MATKWREGSQGAAEQKEARIIGVIFTVISLLVLALLFVIPSDLRDAVKTSSGWLQFFGGLSIAGSAGLIVYTLVKDNDSKEVGKWWAILLVLGILLSTGLFDAVY